MEEELAKLKLELRAIAVSSPVQLDVRSLFKDYRSTMGHSVPIQKWGYRDPLLFLKEKCQDSFLVYGPASNPLLTILVKDHIKHIDKLVQKQRVPTTIKFKGKRMSIPDSALTPKPTLIVDTFNHVKNSLSKQNITTMDNNIATMDSKITTMDNKITTNEQKEQHDIYINKPKEINEKTIKAPLEGNQTTIYEPKEDNENKENSNKNIQQVNDEIYETNSTENWHYNKEAFRNFCARKMASAAITNNEHTDIDNRNGCDKSEREDDDSGRQTSSSNSTNKQLKIEKLKNEIMDLISEHPQGVWCVDLIRLYRTKHKRELTFVQYGYTSILSLVCTMNVVVSRPKDADDWLLSDPRLAPAQDRPPTGHRSRSRCNRSSGPVDAEDALPGIDYEVDVFPEDCMHFTESIPALTVEGLAPGATLEVILGEVYSPSHFWFIRLGELFNIAMEDMMDEMTRYYTSGEGKDRFLARGAVRVGHYCASVFDGDYHRSIIVKIIDSDTVKVRHVDYGTVDTQAVHRLKPLLRRWATLPAQATRGRLAGLRPSGGGRRWPHAASSYFLGLVRNKKLVACVLAADPEEDMVEVIIVDTSTNEDVYIGSEIIKAGYADQRTDSTLHTSESYLYPRFEALENGDTPNFAEIYNYLMDGIALDYVEEYRQHVADCLPSGSPPPVVEDPPALQASTASASTPPLSVVNRIPLQAFSPPSAEVKLSKHTPTMADDNHTTSNESLKTADSSLTKTDSPHSPKNIVISPSMNIQDSPLPPVPESPPIACQPHPLRPTAPVNFAEPRFPMDYSSPMTRHMGPAYPREPVFPQGPGYPHLPVYPQRPMMYQVPAVNAWSFYPMQGQYQPRPPVPMPMPIPHPPQTLTTSPLPPPPGPVNFLPSSVNLSLTDFEIYKVLSSTNQQLAHKFIIDVMERSMADLRLQMASQMSLNTHAQESRSAVAQTENSPAMEGLAPPVQELRQTSKVPPGFEKVLPGFQKVPQGFEK